jgi:aspartate racemase
MELPALRTLGLLGGMSWESTIPYYRILNRCIRERLGGHHSAPLLLCSVDFAQIQAMQTAADWDAAAELLGGKAWSLGNAGAEALLLCTNTMHLVAEQIEQISGLPLLHIADCSAAAIKAAGLSRIGLLGTRYTMELDFYAERLRQRHGIEVVVPEEADRELVDRVIFDELCQGQVLASSRASYQRIIEAMVGDGAEGVLLGCTEIGLLLDPGDIGVPTFDSATLHARAGADYILGQVLLEPDTAQPLALAS